MSLPTATATISVLNSNTVHLLNELFTVTNATGVYLRDRVEGKGTLVHWNGSAWIPTADDNSVITIQLNDLQNWGFLSGQPGAIDLIALQPFNAQGANDSVVSTVITAPATVSFGADSQGNIWDHAQDLQTRGYQFAVVYYNGGLNTPTSANIQTLISHNLQIVPVWENRATNPFTFQNGQNDAAAAIAMAHNFGQTAGSALYFA